MKIFGMGIPELLIILVVALLIFGPKQLPKLGSALGKTVRNLREGISGNKKDSKNETEENVEETAKLEEAPRKKKKASHRVKEEPVVEAEATVEEETTVSA